MASSSAAPNMLTLVSSDDHEYQVVERAAIQSIMIKEMVDSDIADIGSISLPEVDAKTLSRVIVYLYKHAGDGVSAEEKASFDEDFVDVDIQLLTDYILAANYLNIPALLEICARKFADLIKNKSVEKVREIFGIENDFTAAEERRLRRLNAWAFEGVED